MPTFRDVPCVYCNRTFTWQNDANPVGQRICCSPCETRIQARTITCQFCGKRERNQWGGLQTSLRLDLKTCFHCGLWIERLCMPPENLVITPGHEYYSAAWLGIKTPTHGRSEWLGFGGRVWKITWLDGHISHTNNLWSGGTVPEIWRPRFEPNVQKLETVVRVDVFPNLLET